MAEIITKKKNQTQSTGNFQLYSWGKKKESAGGGGGGDDDGCLKRQI